MHDTMAIFVFITVKKTIELLNHVAILLSLKTPIDYGRFLA